jgi:hypothetical protein
MKPVSRKELKTIDLDTLKSMSSDYYKAWEAADKATNRDGDQAHILYDSYRVIESKILDRDQ